MARYAHRRRLSGLTRPDPVVLQTGGAAFMREGPNLLKLARKEQCMALLSQLRSNFKLDGRVYRVFPSGEVQYLHPKDGVYPEKVNKGRVGVNNNMRSIGKNVDPAKARTALTCNRQTNVLSCCSHACFPFLIERFTDQVHRQAGPVRGVNGSEWPRGQTSPEIQTAESSSAVHSSFSTML